LEDLFAGRNQSGEDSGLSPMALNPGIKMNVDIIDEKESLTKIRMVLVGHLPKSQSRMPHRNGRYVATETIAYGNRLIPSEMEFAHCLKPLKLSFFVSCCKVRLPSVSR